MTEDDTWKLLCRYVEVARIIAGGRRIVNADALDTFAPRQFIPSTKRWRIPDPDEFVEEAKRRGLYRPDTLKARIQLMASKNLPEPFPSSPKRPPIINLKFKVNGERMTIVGFSAIYAARHYFDLALQGRPYQFIDEETIRTSDDQHPFIVLSTENEEQMEVLLEHELKGLEKEWVLPNPYRSGALHIAGIASETKSSGEKEPEEMSRRSKKPRKADKQLKQQPDDAIPLKTLCEEIGVTPSRARAALRKAGVEKPSGGWWIAKARCAEVAEIIKSNLK